MGKKITVKSLVDASVAEVWKRWTTPSDIMNWNFATDDWHSPRAENNLQEGGRFSYRMESHSGKEGFDFEGRYTEIVPYSRIAYTLADGRKVTVTFSSGSDGVTVAETFDAENILPAEKQQDGWQMILDRFRKYVENLKSGMIIAPIIPCLWFDRRAEEAVNFYLSVFKNSEIGNILRYPNAGKETHGHEEGEILTIDFRLNDLWFTALNGGSEFEFNEAVSLQILCDTQAEIDYYWEKLTDGGEESVCGWLKDRFGLSWQVVPSLLPELLKDRTRAQRVVETFLKMKKFDIDRLLKA